MKSKAKKKKNKVKLSNRRRNEHQSRRCLNLRIQSWSCAGSKMGPGNDYHECGSQVYYIEGVKISILYGTTDKHSKVTHKCDKTHSQKTL